MEFSDLNRAFSRVRGAYSCFLARTRYKFLINFVLANYNPNYLYPQFSNSFQLMTGKEMETKVKSLGFFCVVVVLFCFFTLATVCLEFTNTYPIPKTDHFRRQSNKKSIIR